MTQQYMFKKSGSIVTIEKLIFIIEGKKSTLKGYTVRRVDTGKEFFAPYGSLEKYHEEVEAKVNHDA